MDLNLLRPKTLKLALQNNKSTISIENSYIDCRCCCSVPETLRCFFRKRMLI